MRILFYHAARGWSGSTRAFAEAARGLAARGHQVTFVCLPDSQVEQRLDYEAYEVLPIPDGSWLRAAWKLRHVLTLRLVETIFVHTEREHLIVSLASRLAGRSAVVRRVEAGGRPAVGRRARMAMRLAPIRWLFALEDDVHAAPKTAGAVLEPFLALPGVDPERYEDVRSVAPASLGTGGSERMIICLYNAESRVRAAVVLRTIAMLAPLHPELGLVLVGPGSEGEDLQMHAAALGITNRVSFLGDREDYLSLVEAAELGWVVSAGDDAVFAYLDLLALRTPVLAARDSIAQRYIANGITGLLLAPGETTATAAALARLLAHDEERRAMGSAARARVAREFTLDSMVDGFERAAIAAGDRSSWRK